MSLRIFNSLSGQKEEFKPIKQGEVKMYVCGPTVYDEPHIGHLRSAYVFEVIRKYLAYSGCKVSFVRNVTDVDDKIIEKARQRGGADLKEEARRVTEQYYETYQTDLARLEIRPPDHEPRASQHIPQMIELIQRLVANGAAYVSGGDVYYEVSRFPRYGQLSHQKRDSMMDHVRIEPNERKKDPLDFALWKSSKEGELSWESPWGPGRPGWHIECSAMSMKYLGETFDIHGGGRDLIFPHHENEIAQSQAVTGKPLANIWIHHGLVTVNEQKMSKSVKNYIRLDDIRAQFGFSTGDLKFLFMGTHYSAPLDFSGEHMKMAQAVHERFLNFFWELDRKKIDVKPKSDQGLEELDQAFREAMDDDFNVPGAMAVMHKILDYARHHGDKRVFCFAGERIMEYLEIFAVAEHMKQLVYGRGRSEKWVRDRIDERLLARKNKDFKRADEIRKQLLTELGIELIDEADGNTSWRWKSAAGDAIGEDSAARSAE